MTMRSRVPATSGPLPFFVTFVIASDPRAVKFGNFLPIAQLWLSLRFSWDGFSEVLMQSRNVYALLPFVLCSSFTVWPQTAAQLRDLSSVRPMDRILLPIANDRRAVLSGQRHPLATPGVLYR